VKRWMWVGGLVLFGLLVGGYVVHHRANPYRDAMIPGQIIVGFQKGISVKDASASLKKYGLEFQETETANLGRGFYEHTDAKFVVKVPEGKESKWCKTLAQEPGVFDADLSYDPGKLNID